MFLTQMQVNPDEKKLMKKTPQEHFDPHKICYDRL